MSESNFQKGDIMSNRNKNERTEFCARSCYSQGKGVGSVKDLIESAKTCGISAMALADDYSTGGFDEFEKLATKNGIRPIYGCTFNVDGDRVIGIAKNSEGIASLNKAISEATPAVLNCHPSNKYLDFKDLRRSLILIGILEDYEKFADYLRLYDYVGVKEGADYPEEFYSSKNKRILAISDSYYPNKNDRVLFEALTKKPSAQTEKLRSQEEMLNLFPAEWIEDNPNAVLALIDDIRIPPIEDFADPYTISPNAFRSLVNRCAKEKLGDLTPEIKRRLDAELDAVIASNSFHCQYLLYILTQPLKSFFLNDAGCSSLVNYLLGVSPINPLVWNIPFQAPASKTKEASLRVPKSSVEEVSKEMVALLKPENVAKVSFYSGYLDFQALDLVSSYLKSTRVAPEELANTKVFKLCSSVKEIRVRPYSYYFKAKEASFLPHGPLRKETDKDAVPVLVGDPRKLSLYFNKTSFVPFIYLDILNQLEEEAPVAFDSIPSDEEVMSLFEEDAALGKKKAILKDIHPLIGLPGLLPTHDQEEAREIISGCKINDVVDLVKLLGFLHGIGAWSKTGETLLQKGYELKDIPTSKEDVINLFEGHSLSESDAYRIADGVARGRGIKAEDEDKLTGAGIPTDLIQYMEKVEYLVSKGYLVQMALLIFKLAYYKIHCPIEFYESNLNIGHSFEVGRLESYTQEELIEGYEDESIPEPYRPIIEMILEAKERGYTYQIEDGRIRFWRE